ncbi:ANK [Seminavis robusta]|uniref:ANK n=1 Tax=Seminavis robusta TaxID=568900 RepID=A0A9N8DAW8_9STRA|nr:ANK [Seminavis robusta]|eukprot:Sro65_g036890.1 ANK (324) ;mRNA; f:109000-109971
MASEANRSLSILVAIANEQRAILKRQQLDARLLQCAVPLKKRRIGAYGIPMMRMMPSATNPFLSLAPTATNPFLSLAVGNALMAPTFNRVAPTFNTVARVTPMPAAANTLVVPKAKAQLNTVTKEPAKAAVEVAAPVKPAPKPKPQVTPKQYLEQLFKDQNIGPKQIPPRYTKGSFVKPDTKESDSYNAAAVLVRSNNLEKLKELHQQGKNLDACNRVGESLLHLACRRGHVEVAVYLMNEAKVRWDHQDDFGRTVLHDACWRPSPSLELMDAILKVASPEWLMAQDIRGHTPFDYARREHAGAWYDFLVQREEDLKDRLSKL